MLSILSNVQFYDQLQRQGVHTLMWTGGVKKGRVSEILIQGHNSIGKCL